MSAWVIGEKRWTYTGADYEANEDAGSDAEPDLRGVVVSGGCLGGSGDLVIRIFISWSTKGSDAARMRNKAREEFSRGELSIEVEWRRTRMTGRIDDLFALDLLTV